MKRMSGLWDGLTVWVSHKQGHWSSILKEIQRHQRWRKQIRETGPMTLGEQLYEVLRENTDPYRRIHHLRYAGGTSAPTKAPSWVTPQGVSLPLLYRYQIAHTVHHNRGEEHHPLAGQMTVSPLHVIRKVA
jgi:hypothetical protein